MSWTDFPCKLWSGYCDVDGYGRTAQPSISGSRLAHRVAWEEAHGPIPPETPFVLHHCDTPACYELEHLWLGTPADNMADKVSKGRHRHADNQLKTHCVNGHEFSDENTYIRPWPNGRTSRVCRACKRDKYREGRENHGSV